MNTQDKTWEIASPIQANMAVHEGECAYVLGSKREDNPYTKAKNAMTSYDDGRYYALMDLASQWDSGYSIAQRTIE